MKVQIDGQDITRLATINSMYANGDIMAFDDRGTEYKLPVSTILTMLNDYNFTGTVSKKYIHLIEATPKEDIN